MAARRSWFHCRLAACLLVLAAGCQGQNDPPKNIAPQANPMAGARMDASVAEETYIQMGLPAPDRGWSGNDMVQAMNVLAALAEKEPEKLPRYKSERSGTVFDRVTTTDNLDFFKNRALPLEGRMSQMLAYFQSLGLITKSYLSANQGKANLGGELIELVGAQVRAANLLMELVQELIPTFDKNDGKYEVRMAGLKQMKQGLAQVVAGSLTTLTERNAFTSDERGRLLGYLGDTLPSMAPHLSEASQQEVLVRLERMSKDADLQDMRARLVELRGNVQVALKKAKTP